MTSRAFSQKETVFLTKHLQFLHSFFSKVTIFKQTAVLSTIRYTDILDPEGYIALSNVFLQDFCSFDVIQAGFSVVVIAPFVQLKRFGEGFMVPMYLHVLCILCWGDVAMQLYFFTH